MMSIKPHLQLLLWTALVSLTEQHVISTAQGKLRGVPNEGYVSYTSIPYGTATGPTGRYKMAGVAPSWTGTRDSASNLCSASSVEDCLRVDVHVPTETAGTWPVLVWVSGGSGPFAPGMLVRQGIIVVVAYHRHGPLGFVCSSSENVPGNVGVKDVVSALRWIRDNIVAFRGNSNKVVIAGQGLGAAMVEALMLSPMADGLYHGAILQSGSILCPWAFNYDARERLMELVNKFDDAGNSTRALLNSKMDDLVAEANRLDVPYFPFAMCLEEPMKKQERLLTDSPYDLMENKQINSVPKIIGFTNNEAYIFVSLFEEAKLSKLSGHRLQALLPVDLKFLNERERIQVTRDIVNMYFNNNDNTTMNAILEYYRDLYFTSHIHRSVRLHGIASSAPTYYYQFSHVGNIGIQSDPAIKKEGAAHSDDLAYLFNDEELEGEDGDIQRIIIKFWANFVKVLNPSSTQENAIWEPMKLDKPKLMDISADLRMVDYPYSKGSKKWNEIFEKYYYRRHRRQNN